MRIYKFNTNLQIVNKIIQMGIFYITEVGRVKRRCSYAGFTLLEIMIAISILLIGILGIYALIPRVVSVSIMNSDKLTASQLAREGIEIVRNFRDSNYLKPGVSFDDGLTNCSGGCEIDYNDLDFTNWAEPGRYLKININGFYNYGSGPVDTKFKRKIIITPDTDVLNIKVQITWLSGDLSLETGDLEMEENLYNWR